LLSAEVDSVTLFETTMLLGVAGPTAIERVAFCRTRPLVAAQAPVDGSV
jgi:hypothetical protein